LNVELRSTGGEREDDYDEADAIFDPVLFEEQLYRVTMDAFETERGTYGRPRALQGTGIPRFYASGTVHPSSIKNDPRPISPPFILLEYIEGYDLNTVDPKLISRTLARRLLHTIHMLGQSGVAHTDLHKSNILFAHDPVSPALSPGTPFTRAVVMDFGQALLRDDSDSDEDWREAVEFQDDFGRASEYMQQVGARDDNPIRPDNFAASTVTCFLVVHDL
jgi:serine/threonine protein kinase